MLEIPLTKLLHWANVIIFQSISAAIDRYRQNSGSFAFDIPATTQLGTHNSRFILIVFVLDH